MPGSTKLIPGDTEMIPGVHINVILNVQLQIKLQRKKKPRYSTKSMWLLSLDFKGTHIKPKHHRPFSWLT